MKLTPTFHATPKYYIQCAHDRAISPGFQQRMCARYDLTPSAVLDCGHMPMFTAPEAMAGALRAILDEVAG